MYNLDLKAPSFYKSGSELSRESLPVLVGCTGTLVYNTLLVTVRQEPK